MVYQVQRPENNSGPINRKKGQYELQNGIAIHLTVHKLFTQIWNIVG